VKNKNIGIPMMHVETRSPAVWRVLVGAFFAIFVGGLYYIFDDLKMKVELGEILTWFFLGAGVIGITFGLIYGFVIVRINELLVATKNIAENVATKEDQVIIKDELLGAAEQITNSYQLATKSLLITAQKTGLKGMYETFSDFESNFKKILEGASREVKFLGISLSTIGRIAEFNSIIEDKASNNVSFQFAFMGKNNGEVDLFKQRAIDENYPVDNMSDLSAMAKNNINSIAAFRKTLDEKARENIEIGEYNALPYMALFIIDDRLFVGTYLFGEKCNISPVYEINKIEGGVYHTYYSHFLRVWKSAALVRDIEKT